MALGGVPNGICDPWARWLGACLAPTASFPFPFSVWVGRFCSRPAVARFLGLDNVILQPHQGSATQETRAAMALLQFRNLACYADGAPLPTCVTKVCTPA